MFWPRHGRSDPFFQEPKSSNDRRSKKYAKTDLSTLDSAYTYLRGALPDLPYPTVEGMKTILAEMSRTRPELLKTDVTTMVDTSIVKTIDEEGFLKRISKP